LLRALASALGALELRVAARLCISPTFRALESHFQTWRL